MGFYGLSKDDEHPTVAKAPIGILLMVRSVLFEILFLKELVCGVKIGVSRHMQAVKLCSNKSFSFNWECRPTQLDLDNGHEMLVVIVIVWTV